MKRQPGGALVQRALSVMLNLLHKAGAAGVSAQDIRVAITPADDQTLFAAARYARERGIPVVAERRGRDSRWHLAPYDSLMHKKWRMRIINDAYAELIRAHQALKPSNSPECPTILHGCVVIGGLLGKPVDEIVDDAQPIPIPAKMKTSLQELGYLPPTTIEVDA